MKRDTSYQFLGFYSFFHFFQVAACETVGLIGNPKYIYMTWALNWGLVYDLPNETWILSQKNGQHKFPKPIVQRRHRRDLYSHLENIIDKLVL